MLCCFKTKTTNIQEIDEKVRSAMKYISDMDQSNLYYGVLATQDPASLCEMTQTRKKAINRLKNEKFNNQRNIGNQVCNSFIFLLFNFS